MMKVFVLYYASCDREVLIDIFSTREKAEKRIKDYTEYDRPRLYIEEEVVL